MRNSAIEGDSSGEPLETWAGHPSEITSASPANLNPSQEVIISGESIARVHPSKGTCAISTSSRCTNTHRSSVNPSTQPMFNRHCLDDYMRPWFISAGFDHSQNSCAAAHGHDNLNIRMMNRHSDDREVGARAHLKSRLVQIPNQTIWNSVQFCTQIDAELADQLNVILNSFPLHSACGTPDSADRIPLSKAYRWC
jgi:hypothetical protein